MNINIKEIKDFNFKNEILEGMREEMKNPKRQHMIALPSVREHLNIYNDNLYIDNDLDDI